MNYETDWSQNKNSNQGGISQKSYVEMIDTKKLQHSILKTQTIEEKFQITLGNKNVNMKDEVV